VWYVVQYYSVVSTAAVIRLALIAQSGSGTTYRWRCVTTTNTRLCLPVHTTQRQRRLSTIRGHRNVINCNGQCLSFFSWRLFCVFILSNCYLTTKTRCAHILSDYFDDLCRFIESEFFKCKTLSLIRIVTVLFTGANNCK